MGELDFDHNRRSRGEAPARSPARRDRPAIALPGEDIPAEVNEAFLEALAYERALSRARSLATPSNFDAEARRAVWGQVHTSDAAAAVLA